ncbi:MAG: hypothetical protein WCK09_00255 [Bacteroidota bacterium]
MKEELNYTTPKTSKEISELGIRWKASKYWAFVPGQNHFILKNKGEYFQKAFPAYNMTELGHMIPFGFFNEMKIHKYLNGYFKLKMSDGKWRTFTSEAEARARYLIDLITIGKVTIDDPAKKAQVSDKHLPPVKD